MKKLFVFITFLIAGAVAAESYSAAGNGASGKAKIHISGTLSGTEPMPGRHHTSWILEMPDGDIYLFDAGENCGRSAYFRGLDLTRLKAVFISHGHPDHTAGLIHFFSVIRKIHRKFHSVHETRAVIYFPEPSMPEAFFKYLNAFYSRPEKTDITAKILTDGGKYEDENIKVEFLANNHIKVAAGENKKAFSFRISVAGKTVIYSGDIKKPEELEKWLKDGCDVILMENGHHLPQKVCAKWKELPVRHLVFLHHGREYLNYPIETLRKCRNIWKSKLTFTDEKTILEL